MSLIQREGRPTLDLAPDSTPDKAGWAEKYETSMNEDNHPVPEKSGECPPNGWQEQTKFDRHRIAVVTGREELE